MKVPRVYNVGLYSTIYIVYIQQRIETRSLPLTSGHIRLQRAFMPEQLQAMPGESEKLNSKIEHAAADGQLMDSAAKNIRNFLAGAASGLYSQVVNELVAADAWPELNHRLYQTLTFV